MTAPSPSLRLGLVASALAAALALSVALAGCSGTDDSAATAGLTERSSTAAPSEARTTPVTPSDSAVAKVRHAGPPLHRTHAWLLKMRLRQIVADNPLAARPWGVYEGDGELAWAPYAPRLG